MKNVYITLSKKGINRPLLKNTMSPSTLKKKILQTQSSNQSFTNDMMDNNKFSTIYLQGKPNNMYEDKVSQRLLT